MSPTGQEVHAEKSMSSMKPQTLDEVLRCRAELTPDAPILWYPAGGADTSYSPNTAAELDCYVERTANAYAPLIGRRTTSSQSPKTVALLGVSDLDYVITQYALCRLGHTALTLSPRLALDGHMHLANLYDVHHVIYHHSLAKMANSIHNMNSAIQTHKLIGGDVYRQTDQLDIKPLDQQLDSDVESKNVAIIVHSSGSTGLPKPSEVRNGGMVMATSKFNNKRAYNCVPFYHGFGLMSLSAAILFGRPYYFHDASSPLTYESLRAGLECSKAEMFYCVPYALKLLAESDAGVNVLKTCKEVLFSGSACPDDLGDILTAKGVRIVGLYGSSELGPVMSTNRPDDDDAWNYLRPFPHVKPFLTFEERPEGLYELVCRDGYPFKMATNRDDGSYASKDLFAKHPTIEDSYRFICRHDDTLVLSNGEKANPLVLEGTVRRHPLIIEAVVFGVGKPELGIMVITSELAMIQHASEDEIKDQIWPLIADAQRDMPQYAKISRSMVKILPPGTQYPRTDKDTIIRAKFYTKFAQEIEDAYIDQTSGSRVKLESQEQVQSLILAEATNILELDGMEDLTIDTNLFSLGVDSLKSIQLRRSILSRLEVASLPLNVVYEYPTIRQLSDFIYNFSDGQTIAQNKSLDSVFKSMMQEYGDFTMQPTKAHERFVVVLTGATGSLGSHLLGQLLKNELVDRVYCLVRAAGPRQNASTQHASERVNQALQARKLYDGLKDAERAKIVALVSDLAMENLGVDSATYRDITMTATTVIHAAWPVNFNMNLASFKPDIAGVKNLINLCSSPDRTTQATFGFCSSVSTSLNSPSETVSETVSSQLSTAAQIGYGQSKLIAENLCLKAAEQRGVKTSIFRIGQVIGDTDHGIWKVDEAITLMMQTAETIGALPDIDELHRWLPVDVTAKTIIEISLSIKEQAPAGTVFNIVNPASFRWRSDLLPKLQEAGLTFKVVSTEEWLERLRNSEQDGAINPPIKLLHVYESQYGAEGQLKMRELSWDTHNTAKYSPTFSGGWQLSTETVQKFVDYFRTSCWHPSEHAQASRKDSSTSVKTLTDDAGNDVQGVALIKEAAVRWDADVSQFKLESTK